MARGRRSTGPRYFPSKNGWFAEIAGDRTPLVKGPEKETEEEAWRKYHQLALACDETTEGDKRAVVNIMRSFLDYAKNGPDPLAPSTQKNHTDAINSLVAHVYNGTPVGEVRWCDFKRAHIDDWIATNKQQRGWKANTANLYWRNIRTASLWARNEGGLVTSTPFDRRGRGPQADFSITRLAITEEEHLALLDSADARRRGSFGLFLRILYDSGARPAEVYRATKAEWKKELGAFVIKPTEENIGRLKKRRHLQRRGQMRYIHVSSDLVPDIERLTEKFPEGDLFRNEKDEPWRDAQDIGQRFSSLVKTTNAFLERNQRPLVREDLVLYSYRHAYITRFLLADKSAGGLLKLCALVDTSVEMVQKHYSHLFEAHTELRAAFDAMATAKALPPDVPQIAGSVSGSSSSESASPEPAQAQPA